MEAEIVVQVPARPDYLRILRTVAAGAAVRLDLTYDRIEDLRLAVDEAAAMLLAIGTDGLTMRLRALDHRLLVELCAPGVGEPDGWPPVSSIGWRILEGLAHHVAAVRFDESPAIRFELEGVGA